MTDSPLKAWLERDGALLRLRLARPKANVIDAAMIAALSQAFDAHRGNAGLLAALVDHEGPHFSFGASVEEHLPGSCEQMLASLHALIGAMLEWPRPILVAIRGQCLGGGLEFALAGNLMLAAPDAQFGQPEMKLGVFAPAASVLLPLRIGQARAEDLLYSGRSIDAATALAWGLVNEVADDPAAAAAAYFDKHLAGKSAAALAHAVRAAREPFADLARARLADVEALYLEKLMATRDANEGLTAFLEKRTPQWEHR
ncbi:MAG: cyclohexa-1,5-dienecarbonyl-CoA hydratase [Betaproteobacteria bacterium]|nr:cyclohexa-1,5-dienecarbonyl-CoA hydratase [Betaproteobacteria bacterium]MDH5222401.1 cyclohexa-1,5-dienecarbonyl-CoA hydratase [Betaproteobacteria bacterium]MDH5351783.1 cyclohexa-1,5-dienecarbonyl-CoA hydratase [Betaproteobacteria bacterium]